MPLRPAPLTRNAHLPGPTLCPHPSPSLHGHHLCHYFTPHPPRARPGRVPHLGSASPPHPAGLGFVGKSSFVAFYEESRTPPRSPPHLPRAPPSALRPQGPGTTVAGPTQDQGAWASPLSQIWGGETGASPHHTCGCSHIPLTIPGKIKPQNCTGASSLQKRPPLSGGLDKVRGGGEEGRGPGA